MLSLRWFWYLAAKNSDNFRQIQPVLYELKDKDLPDYTFQHGAKRSKFR